jgi:transaldolase/glucose-6-phosphate isomerase
MNELCRRTGNGESNPAQTLAAFLAAAVMTGNDRLLLFGTASLAALTHRVAQLVGVSTSKGGRGLIPICTENAPAVETLQEACAAAIFRLHGDEDSPVDRLIEQLKTRDVPFVSIELSSPEEIGAELFKWEVATALACALLEVNPFDEPDLQESTNIVADLVEKLATRRPLPPRTVRIQEEGIDLYAEGETRRQISTLNLSEALRTFFEAKDPSGYVATLAFLDRGARFRAVLERIRNQIASRLGIPALLSFGPRYLHHLGQVFQGGPSKGLFLMITGEPSQDISIPGAGYSFGQLQMALALGDFDSLERHHRPVLRLHLTEGAESGLGKLENVLQQALRNVRNNT